MLSHADTPTPFVSPGIFSHRYTGSLEFRNMIMPNMHVMRLDWASAGENIVLSDEVDSSGSININFQLGGFMYSQFTGMKRDLDMKPLTHNMIYTPEIGSVNHVNGNQDMSFLHISIDKHFFMSMLSEEDIFGKKLLDDMNHQRPFSMSEKSLEITPRMQLLIAAILNCKEPKPMQNLLIQSHVLELVALELGQFRGAAIGNQEIALDDLEKLHRLKLYIDTNYLESHSLDSLSRLFMLNEFKVKKGFKQLYGTTVFAYIKEMRMQHAARLLQDTTATMDEIAFAVGYEHAHHFTAAFKKYFGLTPSVYKGSR